MPSYATHTSVSTSSSHHLLNLVPVPQLAYKADNELFIAVIHLHTSHGNCFLLWFSLWLCIPPGNPPSKLNKETTGPVISADEWVYTQLIFQWDGTGMRKKRGRISFCQLKSTKEPNLLSVVQRFHVEVHSCLTICGGGGGLVKSRTVWIGLEDDHALFLLHWMTQLRISMLICTTTATV